jgi:hypothetical protein
VHELLWWKIIKLHKQYLKKILTLVTMLLKTIALASLATCAVVESAPPHCPQLKYDDGTGGKFSQGTHSNEKF